MKLYQRYLLQPFVLALFLIWPLLAGIYALVEFFDKLDNVTKAKVPVTYLLQYLFWRLPEISFDLWPAVMGLSALMGFAYLARGGELLAFRTLGFSPSKLVLPFLGMAFLWCTLFLVVEETIMPEAAYKARFFWQTKVCKKEPKGLVLKGKLYFRGPDSFLIGKVVDPTASYLREVTYARVTQEGWPRLVIWAQQARYEKGGWLFEKGILLRLPGSQEPRWFEQIKIKLAFSPETVLVVKRTPRLQHLKELWAQRNFLLKAELPVTFTESEIAYRVCYPLLGACLVVLVLPALLLERGRKTLGRGISLGILALAGGVGLFMGAKALGDAGYCSPLLAQPAGLGAVLLSGVVFLKSVKT